MQPLEELRDEVSTENTIYATFVLAFDLCFVMLSVMVAHSKRWKKDGLQAAITDKRLWYYHKLP